MLEVDALVRRVQIAVGLGKPGQHGRHPDMLEDCTLGADAVDDRLDLQIVQPRTPVDHFRPDDQAAVVAEV